MLAGVTSGPDSLLLLPTPTARDCKGRNQRDDASCLPGAVNLLPTTTAGDSKWGANGNTPGDGYGVSLTDAVLGQFDRYAAAVARHAHIFGSPPPPPHDEKRRLNPAFVEWMMGVRARWVPDVIATRTHQLRVLGNGVVPAQAVAALRSLDVEPAA